MKFHVLMREREREEGAGGTVPRLSKTSVRPAAGPLGLPSPACYSIDDYGLECGKVFEII